MTNVNNPQYIAQRPFITDYFTRSPDPIDLSSTPTDEIPYMALPSPLEPYIEQGTESTADGLFDAAKGEVDPDDHCDWRFVSSTNPIPYSLTLVYTGASRATIFTTVCERLAKAVILAQEFQVEAALTTFRTTLKSCLQHACLDGGISIDAILNGVRLRRKLWLPPQATAKRCLMLVQEAIEIWDLVDPRRARHLKVIKDAVMREWKGENADVLWC